MSDHNDNTNAFGRYLGAGPTPPPDGDGGWTPDALFNHTDASYANDGWHINEGSLASANFDRIIFMRASGGADSASGLIAGVGTSANPATTATADGKFLEFRCESTATSGDNRLLYMQYILGGGGGGECLRARTTVDSNLGTAHGAHFGLEFTATAAASECSGLGVANRGTLHIPNVASWAPTGTYAAGMFEIYSDGANSDPAGMTELSVLRLLNSGNATGMADVDTDAHLMSVQGFTAAADTTKTLSSVSLNELPAGTVGLRCKIGALLYRLPFVLESAWN